MEEDHGVRFLCEGGCGGCTTEGEGGDLMVYYKQQWYAINYSLKSSLLRKTASSVLKETQKQAEFLVYKVINRI